jgi:hypothetical protein
MPLEQNTALDIVRMLIEGTNNGKIKWEPDPASAEGDVFLTGLAAGGVRLSHVVAFSGFAGSGGPFLLELLDPKGRSLFQFRPQATEDTSLVQELFDLARRRALNLDQTLGALLDEIRSRTEKR